MINLEYLEDWCKLFKCRMSKVIFNKIVRSEKKGLNLIVKL